MPCFKIRLDYIVSRLGGGLAVSRAAVIISCARLLAGFAGTPERIAECTNLFIQQAMQGGIREGFITIYMLCNYQTLCSWSSSTYSILFKVID